MDDDYFNINYQNYGLAVGKLLQSLLNILILLLVLVMINVAMYFMSKACGNQK
jgi:hypothetical protein